MDQNQSNNYTKKLQKFLHVSSLDDLVLYKRVAPSQQSEQICDQIKLCSLYKIHKILGAGGFGVVCEATCRETGRKLALKLIRYDEKEPSNEALSLESEY